MKVQVQKKKMSYRARYPAQRKSFKTIYSGRRTFDPFKRRIRKYGRAYANNTAYGKASNALRLVRKLKNEVEKKEILGVTNTGLANNTPLPFLLNHIAKGDSSTERIGTKVTMKTLYMKIRLNINSTDTVGGNIRIVIVYDRQTNGTALTWTKVFSKAGAGSSSIVNLIDRTENKGKRQVLYDETINIPADKDYVLRDIYIPLKDKAIEFNTGTAGDVADINKGSIYIMGFANCVGTAGLLANYRILYEDV